MSKRQRLIDCDFFHRNDLVSQVVVSAILIMDTDLLISYESKRKTLQIRFHSETLIINSKFMALQILLSKLPGIYFLCHSNDCIYTVHSQNSRFWKSSMTTDGRLSVRLQGRKYPGLLWEFYPEVSFCQIYWSIHRSYLVFFLLWTSVKIFFRFALMWEKYFVPCLCW